MNEKCAVCNSETDIPRETPTEYRINYIDGCGQLCDDCFIKIFGTETNNLEIN